MECYEIHDNICRDMAWKLLGTLLVFSLCILEGMVYAAGDHSSNTELSPELTGSSEKLLISSIYRKYKRYGTDGRPVLNASHPVNVQFGLGLIKMELMEKENMLSMSVWTRYRWRDEYLQWNPDDFAGVDNVKLTCTRIWLPDVMLYNTANPDESLHDISKVKVIVEHDGWVTWFPHKVFHSSCAVNVRNFPFDNQTCNLLFGSWTHPVHELNLDLAFPGGIDLSTFGSVYKDASKWEIDNNTAERITLPEEGFPQFAIISFTLKLKRKMMFSTYILTMPAIFLSFLTLLAFWLPPEHADKSALGLTIFGSVLLLLLILVEAAPPTASAVPLLGLYYCFTTVLVILSIFLSSLVLKVGKGGNHKKQIPRWAHVIFLKGLARILFPSQTDICPSRTCQIRGRSSSVNCHMDKDSGISEDHMIMQNLMDMEEPRIDGMNVHALTQLDKRLKSLNNLLDDVVHRQREKENAASAAEKIESEWCQLAAILDRMFFVIYLIVIILSLIILFPREAEG